MNKLIVAVVHDEDSNSLMKSLVKSEFGVTRLASTGGFLRAGNTTLFIGVEEQRLEEALEIIRNTCSTRREVTASSSVIGEGAMIGIPLEITVGGATVFVLDVERHLRI